MTIFDPTQDSEVEDSEKDVLLWNSFTGFKISLTSRIQLDMCEAAVATLCNEGDSGSKTLKLPLVMFMYYIHTDIMLLMAVCDSTRGYDRLMSLGNCLSSWSTLQEALQGYSLQAHLPLLAMEATIILYQPAS